MNIGFLHPGNMGVSVAASAISAGHRALWASQGRGGATRARAREHGLEDVGSVAALCARSDMVFSICPPHAAEDVAGQVAATGFGGIFIDANAISPQRMARVADIAAAGAAEVVDGGIVGLPAWQPDRTWLHLSGPKRVAVARCFEGAALRTALHSDRIGEASGLKMCYAGLNKATTALLCSVIATAEQLGVRDALMRQWDRDVEGQAAAREKAVCAVTAKAWRFVDELEEISRTFAAAGQPDGFHLASADVYRRLADLKAGPHPTPVDVVLTRLSGGR